MDRFYAALRTVIERYWEPAEVERRQNQKWWADAAFGWAARAEEWKQMLAEL